MQFVAFAALAALLFATILLRRHLIQHHIRIGDAGEGNLQLPNLQSLCFGLIAPMNSRQQRRADLRLISHDVLRPRGSGSSLITGCGGTYFARNHIAPDAPIMTATEISAPVMAPA